MMIILPKDLLNVFANLTNILLNNDQFVKFIFFNSVNKLKNVAFYSSKKKSLS